MSSKRSLYFCGILAAFTVMLQTAPRILGPTFAFFLLLDGLPVYLAVRIHYIYGIIVYSAAVAVSASINTGEAVFFICTNGIIGLSLGVTKGRFRSIYPAPAFSAVIVFAMFSAAGSLLDLQIFGYTGQNIGLTQFLTFLLLLYLYCLIYLRLAMAADYLLHKHIELNLPYSSAEKKPFLR